MAACAQCASYPSDGHKAERPVTTLMVRNLPRRFTSRDLLVELELYARAGMFDYVYVPWDRKGSNNVGYAFVNFVHAAHAAETQRRMHEQPWRTGSRARLVKVQPAHVQGLAENLERFAEQEGAEDPMHAPLLFVDGEPASLEEVLRGAQPSSCGSSTAATCEDGGFVTPRVWTSTSSTCKEHSVECPAPATARQLGATSTAGVTRPPPGLEDVVPRSPAEPLSAGPLMYSPGVFRPPPGLGADHSSADSFEASRQEVSAMLRQLLARRPA